MQLLSGGSDVETALGDGGEVAQLMQFHGARIAKYTPVYSTLAVYNC
jgi:hypothetical protein